MTNYDISVVMPALNEEANVERAVCETFAAFARLEIKGEVVLINDGSRDKTGEIGERLKHRFPSLNVISHRVPHGIGASFWGGRSRGLR